MIENGESTSVAKPSTESEEPDEPDPAKQFAVIRPHSSPIPMDVLDSLVRAVTQYGDVPSQFSSEFSDR